MSEIKPAFMRLPTEAVAWSKLVEATKDAYWQARRNGRDETSALLMAMDVAVAIATGQQS